MGEHETKELTMPVSGVLLSQIEAAHAAAGAEPKVYVRTGDGDRLVIGVRVEKDPGARSGRVILEVAPAGLKSR